MMMMMMMMMIIIIIIIMSHNKKKITELARLTSKQQKQERCRFLRKIRASLKTGKF